MGVILQPDLNFCTKTDGDRILLTQLFGVTNTGNNQKGTGCTVQGAPLALWVIISFSGPKWSCNQAGPLGAFLRVGEQALLHILCFSSSPKYLDNSI